ncbi:hypothetical protein ACFLVW_06825 [Chloroflexota bacterium]
MVYLIITESEDFVISGADFKMPLPRLKPGFFYLLNLIVFSLPKKRFWSFGVGMAGIAVYFKAV